MSSLPEVRFQYSFLLKEQASHYIGKHFAPDTELRSDKYYTDIAIKYWDWWAPYSEQILRAMTEETGLEFYQNTIDIYVAPWFYAFSNPMVIGVKFKSQEELVAVVTHELLHRILTDNTSHEFWYDYQTEQRTLYGDEHSRVTLNHIPVHALLQKIFIDHLKRPDLLEIDRKSIDKNPHYAKAWEYVDTHGYQTIIDELNKVNATAKKGSVRYDE